MNRKLALVIILALVGVLVGLVAANVVITEKSVGGVKTFYLHKP